MLNNMPCPVSLQNMCCLIWPLVCLFQMNMFAFAQSLRFAKDCMLSQRLSLAFFFLILYDPTSSRQIYSSAFRHYELMLRWGCSVDQFIFTTKYIIQHIHTSKMYLEIVPQDLHSFKVLAFSSFDLCKCSMLHTTVGIYCSWRNNYYSLCV